MRSVSLFIKTIMTANNRSSPISPSNMGFKEFVTLIASLMALNALAIDAMLPALPDIGHSLQIMQENHRQWVITSYLLGFSIAQLFWGTLSDRFGRRPILLGGLFFYIVFSALSAFSESFAMMMTARALQGVASAAARTLAVSMVRDRFSGRQMARVMSLSFIVFMAVPILAPAIGQLILYVAPWQWIFGVLGIFAAIVMIWAYIRLPETLHAENKQSLSPSAWLSSWKVVLSDRMSVGYTLALTLLSGALFGFINSVQQIFFDIFDAQSSFPFVFAAMAGTMAVSSFINSRIVERVGTRKVSHWAIIGFTLAAFTQMALAMTGHHTLVSFAIMQATMMACFGLATANFGAMAMESLGRVAGSAASLQGFFSTLGGALLGLLIGQLFDGTTVPVSTGFAVLGLGAIITVFITEKGRLFQAHHPIN